MGNFTPKKWTVSSKDTGESGKPDRFKNGRGTTRNPGRNPQYQPRHIQIQQKGLQPIDTHYLEKSFDFYPCSCKFNKILTVKIGLRCHDCMMSTQSRISHMKTKI